MTISKNTIANVMPSFSELTAIAEANVKIIRDAALAKLTKKFANACNDYPEILDTYNWYFKESCLYDINENGGMTVESLADAHENAMEEAIAKAGKLEDQEPCNSRLEDKYESSRFGK